jgi:hypothetical protein
VHLQPDQARRRVLVALLREAERHERRAVEPGLDAQVLADALDLEVVPLVLLEQLGAVRVVLQPTVRVDAADLAALAPVDRDLRAFLLRRHAHEDAGVERPLYLRRAAEDEVAVLPLGVDQSALALLALAAGDRAILDRPGRVAVVAAAFVTQPASDLSSNSRVGDCAAVVARSASGASRAESGPGLRIHGS